MSNSYRASKKTDLNETWQPSRELISDAEYSGELVEIWARCHDLCRNNALAASVLTVLVDYIASTGLTPALGDPAAMDVWEQWAKDCTIQGGRTWEDVYRDIVGAEAETGDILVMMLHDSASDFLKTKIDLVESTRVRTPDDVKTGELFKGCEVRHGVAYKNSKEFGYWVSNIESGVVVGGNSKNFKFVQCYNKGRFNARLVRRPDKLRPGQSRQLPIFVHGVQQFKDVDDFWDAAIAAARTASLINVIFTSNDPDQIGEATGHDKTATASTDALGNPKLLGNLSSGGIIRAPWGTTTETVVPSGASDVDMYIVRSVRILGASMGIPLELIMRDFSSTNFSSGKLAIDGMYKMGDRWNRGNATQIADEIYKSIIFEAYLRNDPRVPEYNIDVYTTKWIGGSKSYNADPSKESIGEERRINNNVTTEEIVCSEKGINYSDVLRSKARILKAQKMLEDEYELEPGSLQRLKVMETQQKMQAPQTETKPESKEVTNA